MSYKFGCSLNFSTFTNEPTEGAVQLYNKFGTKEKLLEFCSESLDTVELRTVRRGADPLDVLNAVMLLNSYGITVTIHGVIGYADEFFAPYLLLLDEKLQSSYNITVHPAKTVEETERMLREICQRIEEKQYPVFITLENQRIKNGSTFGVCEDVLRIVKNIASPHLGICFDFGHQVSNEHLVCPDPVSDEFISLVRHTHIHSFYDGRTHFPLDCGETLLEGNVFALLKSGYDGVLSLELEHERYSDKFDIRASLESSVSVLKTAVAQIESKEKAKAFYQNGYQSTLEKLFERFDGAENAVALLGHSGYIVKLGGKRIAVDIAPCVAPINDTDVAYILDKIKDFDAYILTHAHYDHYDRKFFDSLPSGILKLVPDFMDVKHQNTVKTSNGSLFTVGELKVGFFESGHSLGASIVPEYGFYIEYKGEKYVFPTDVRDYGFKYPDFDNVRILFAHLWLGKGQALDLYDNKYTEKFCRYVNSFGANEVCIAHLNDVHRTIDEMWSDVHLALIKDKIPNAIAFNAGEIITF